MATAADLGLRVADAIVLRDSDKVTARLLPCDVVARIAHVGREVAAFELELAQRLMDIGSPVAALDPRVEPRMYTRDGFTMTLWTYYEDSSREITPAAYAEALERLHAGMRHVTMPTPRFTDRVAGAQEIVASRELSPELPDAGRELLADALSTMTQTIEARGAPEQLLHGEPHLGNVLRAPDGLLFIDLETCCRGPVEFDIAHAVRLAGSSGGGGLDIDDAAGRYPGADRELVQHCVVLMLALITTWRWQVGDQLPDGERLGRVWLTELRSRFEAIADRCQ
jgi:Ser/Thr protein kinase RdoA (MazF antagonist)